MKQQSQNEKQRANKPSSLLSRDENDLVFALLGRKCQTLCTSVIQLYTTEAPAHSSWIKRISGVACFVRDVAKKSYFIRVYCLAKHELMWEEEMYESILINKTREFLICFEGEDCMVALSFAADAEANLFYKVVTTTTSNRIKRHRDRQSRKHPPGVECAENHGSDESNVILRNAPNAPTPSPFAQMPQASAFVGNMGIGNGRDKKRSNRKLTKADISMPTDFKHIVHVGWSAQKGYDLNNDEVSTLNAFLEKAGVSEQQLNDRDTRAYIYDFIQSHNVLDSVKSEKEQREPPPVPSRNNAMQRIAPPPPPTSNIARPPAQLPSTKPRATPPTRPPPISDHIIQNQTAGSVQIAAAPIPPPPPPPPPPPSMPAAIANATLPNKSQPSSVPVVNDTRNALMESIRKGTTLKKVDPANLSTGSGSDDGRNNLLKEIRQGVELRPAGERELSQRDSNNSAGYGTDALADALKRALQERSRALRLSDEEDDSSDNDEWDD